MIKLGKFTLIRKKSLKMAYIDLNHVVIILDKIDHFLSRKSNDQKRVIYLSRRGRTVEKIFSNIIYNADGAKRVCS